MVRLANHGAAVLGLHWDDAGAVWVSPALHFYVNSSRIATAQIEEEHMESWIFLGAVLAIAALAKNQSLLIGVAVVMVLKLIPAFHPALKLLQGQGINWGVTVISAAIMVPIATGEIGVRELVRVLRSPAGWIAIAMGVLVAVLSAKGVGLLAQSPEMTVALVFGTIMGVVLLRGIAAGPVIASGMTYVVLTVFNLLPGR